MPDNRVLWDSKKEWQYSRIFPPIIDKKDYSSNTTDAKNNYFGWWFYRNIAIDLKDSNEHDSLPSFVALNSKLLESSNESKYITYKSCIPISPYPATQMDSIFTSMINFQDVLLQREEYCGALWCDEAVYCIAKEIQLLRPYQFANIFIGLGPFHWIKIVAAGLGSFLEPSGITEALINAGVYGQGVAESSVMKGGDYIKAKEGMGIIAETMDYMFYEAFQLSESYAVNMASLPLEDTKRDCKEIASLIYNRDLNTDFNQCWEMAKTSISDIQKFF